MGTVSGISVHTQYDARGVPIKTEKIRNYAALVLETPTTPEEIAASSAIAVYRNSGMGDCIMITPALRELHRLFPDKQIYYFVPAPYCELFTGLDYITEVYAIDSTPPVESAKLLNINLSLYVEKHPLRHRVDRITLFAEAFHLSLDDHDIEVYIDRTSNRGINHYRNELEQLGIDFTRPSIGLCWRGLYRHRSWSEVHKRDFALQQAEQDRNVLIFAQHATASGEMPRHSNIFPIAGKGLRDVAHILSLCDVVVSPDTGLLHLAAAVQDKQHRPAIVSIFGPIDPKLRTVWYHNCVALSAKGILDCVPCDEDGRHKTCSLQCRELIRPKNVAIHVDKFLTEFGVIN